MPTLLQLVPILEFCNRFYRSDSPAVGRASEKQYRTRVLFGSYGFPRSIFRNHARIQRYQKSFVVINCACSLGASSFEQLCVICWKNSLFETFYQCQCQELRVLALCPSYSNFWRTPSFLFASPFDSKFYFRDARLGCKFRKNRDQRAFNFQTCNKVRALRVCKKSDSFFSSFSL